VLIVDAENNLIIVKGAVPGKPGNLISIQPYTFNTK
jgi:ribosomal protein L3